MFRFLAMLLCVFAALSLGTTAVAHTMEANTCVASASGKAEAQSGDQEPGKPASDKGYAHQHGCHGHHFVALAPDKGIASHAVASNLPGAKLAPVLHAASTDPALRPPQA